MHDLLGLLVQLGQRGQVVHSLYVLRSGSTQSVGGTEHRTCKC